MSDETAIRVLIVEDHPLTVDGVRALFSLAEDIEVVGHASTGAAALTQVSRVRPDVAMVDLSLPDMSGLQVIASLQADHPEVGVVVLTMHEDEEYVRRAVRAGARGYLFKSDDPGTLSAAVRAVHGGGTHFEGKAAEALMHGVGGPAPARPQLAPREREVLRGIARGRLNKEIADELHLSVRTVETYRSRIMHKLDLHTVADLTRWAIAEGLLHA